MDILWWQGGLIGLGACVVMIIFVSSVAKTQCESQIKPLEEEIRSLRSKVEDLKFQVERGQGGANPPGPNWEY